MRCPLFYWNEFAMSSLFLSSLFMARRPGVRGVCRRDNLFEPYLSRQKCFFNFLNQKVQTIHPHFCCLFQESLHTLTHPVLSVSFPPSFLPPLLISLTWWRRQRTWSCCRRRRPGRSCRQLATLQFGASIYDVPRSEEGGELRNTPNL